MRPASGAAVVAVGVATLAIAVAMAAVQSAPNASPIYGVTLPPRYREWQVVSVAHEAGSLNDIRVTLGNKMAMRAYRAGTRPFPDGTMIARLAWKYVPSARNNAIFGQPQSFVAGDPTNVQIETKDSRRFAATGGWGYGQYEQGAANQSAALLATCFACHDRLAKTEDLVFTHYSP